jgi:glycine cleavage system H protein
VPALRPVKWTRSNQLPESKTRVNVPADLKYTKTHEWIRLEGDLATMGITDFAQSELGDIVYVDAPAPGRAVSEGESIGSVESVKTVSDIYSPLQGVVAETNPALGSQTELINSDPYGQGWMFKIRLNDPSAVEKLMDAKSYEGIIH